MEGTRRQILAASGVFAAGLAGCLDGDSSDDTGEDEEEPTDEPGSDGLLYAFSPDSVAVIDPDDGTVLEEITEGIADATWGDPQLTSDHSTCFVIEQSRSQVIVIDTDQRAVVDEVDVGPDATHSYLPRDGEIWVHSDAEGAFYVIDTEERSVSGIVEASLEGTGHGKLLAHEDLGGVGFGTNVDDPGLSVIDLEERERTAFIEFGDNGGTHYKAYSPESDLVYAEFGDETVVVDPEEETVVDQLPFSGGMYLTPDEQLLGVLDGDEVALVDATDTDSTVVDRIDVGGGPDALRFHDAGGTLYGVTANTQDDQAAILDINAGEVLERVDIGEMERPEDAPFLHRTGVAADGVFASPADADGTVALVDIEAMERTEHVEVAEGVDTLQFVADSGVGYTGRVR